MNFLDDASTTNYSTRAAAASGCAADQDRFVEFARVSSYTSRPRRTGPSDVELAGLGVEAGLTGPAFAACLAAGPYLEWPSYVTARAAEAAVAATPTVLVAGRSRPCPNPAIDHGRRVPGPPGCVTDGPVTAAVNSRPRARFFVCAA